MIKNYLVFGILILLLNACATSPVAQDPNQTPSWVMKPSVNGKMGAIGVAGRTYDNSISSQRKLAIQRALDELSLQTKVRVKQVMYKEETATNSSYNVRTNEKSSYTTDSILTAHIEDVWVDRSSNEIYIWMVLD